MHQADNTLEFCNTAGNNNNSGGGNSRGNVAIGGTGGGNVVRGESAPYDLCNTAMQSFVVWTIVHSPAACDNRVMPFATLQAYVSCVHQAEDALNFAILQATTTIVEGGIAGAMLLLVEPGEAMSFVVSLLPMICVTQLCRALWYGAYYILLWYGAYYILLLNAACDN